MRVRAVLVCFWLVFAGGALGCDDDQSVSGCRVDGDCRGERVCVQSECMPPGEDLEPDPSTTPDGMPDAPNNIPEPVVDAGPADVGEDAPEMDPELPGEDEPDEPPRTVCDEAMEQIETCGFDDPIGVEENRLSWPQCGAFEACAAECALEMDCSALSCDWDNSVDCDFSPWLDCVQSECRDLPEDECQTDADCGEALDCCLPGYVCFPLSDPIDVCDLDCDPNIEPPGCQCQAGRCVQLDTDDGGGSICEAAVARFEGECGYEIEAQRRTRPADHEVLEEMSQGGCGAFEACYAGCVVHENEDQCMSCHFGELDCLRDPFGECVERCRQAPETTLCIQSGGLWGGSDCEDCCGPTGCGGDPFEMCAEPCCGPPQCYCPNDRPFWEADRGCFQDEACFP